MTEKTTDKRFSRRSLLLGITAAPVRVHERAADLRFHPDQDGGFVFDTGVLNGNFRNAGRSIGLLPATHLASGTTLTSSMGLFSIYRVFSDGRRYGKGMWEVSSEAQGPPDGSVAVRWLPDADRPFELRATYRWIEPSSLDIAIAVTAGQDLHVFETFLAAYFGPRFTNSQVLVKGGGLVAAERANGLWQMFPRDRDAVKVIFDGRWKIPPNPVVWTAQPEFEQPVALRRDPSTGLTAVIMAPSRDCFAIAMPHETDSHYSTYLSLFGHDVRKGETARATARLVVLSSPDELLVRRLYREYAHGK